MKELVRGETEYRRMKVVFAAAVVVAAVAEGDADFVDAAHKVVHFRDCWYSLRCSLIAC